MTFGCNIIELLTKCEVKKAGYWRSFFLRVFCSILPSRGASHIINRDINCFSPAENSSQVIQ